MIKPTLLFLLLWMPAACPAVLASEAIPDVTPRATPDAALCFDFSDKVETPLRPPHPLDKKSEVRQGALPDGTEWGAGRGLVPRGISEIKDWLMDHTNWKDKSKTDIEVKELPRPGYFAFHEVAVEVTLFAFISISWVENWAYALLGGTLAKPRKILVSYQKISGTSHLPSLCGSVLLQRVNDRLTDVYLYEQAKASRYKGDDMAKLQIANLKVLRDPTTVMSPPAKGKPKAKD